MPEVQVCDTVTVPAVDTVAVNIAMRPDDPARPTFTRDVHADVVPTVVLGVPSVPPASSTPHRRTRRSPTPVPVKDTVFGDVVVFHTVSATAARAGITECRTGRAPWTYRHH